MADRYRTHHHASRPASANPSRSSLPAGMVFQPSYADDSYLAPAGSRYPVTTPRGHSSSTASCQPTTTRTYAVTQDARFHPRTRDHSHTRRSTMESTARPPVIITTTQKDRSQNNLLLGTGIGNGSPVRDDRRHGDSQHYAVPASTRRSRSSARPYHGDDYHRRRERGDSLLISHDAESYRQLRPSATRSSNSRHSTALVDYGDDGYKYTNAGELVRYDLDNSKPSRSQRHDGLDQDYLRPKPVYADSHRRADGPRYETDRAHVVPHGGPPPSTRGFDKINRESAFDRDRQAPPAAPKPPKPLHHPETVGSLRDAPEVRHSRPVSVSQEPSYRDKSYYMRDDFRDRRGHVHGRSDDRGPENKRPHSAQFYDDSVPNRGFGIRTSPDGALDGGRRDGRHSREEPRRIDYIHSAEMPLSDSRKATRDRPLSFSSASKHLENDRKDKGRDTAYSILETAGTGFGIGAAAAGFAASRRDAEPARGPDEQTESTYSAHAGNLTRHETEVTSPRIPLETPMGQHSPRPEANRAGAEKPAGLSDHGGASLAQHSAPSASDSDDAGKGRMRSKPRPSNSFNPNDTGDLRQIKEQLAALRVQDNQRQSGDSLSGEIERRPRSPSPKYEVQGNSEPGRDDEKYTVGFPVEKKHARVVSPPRDKRDDMPLRGILKQPSARFPEDSNPIREGVAPHKEDKKLKEVPPGARWTSISRKIVNPEALTIGKERFEERADVVIVLRVLSKEEIQAYAAATQILRERRREREDPDREQERRRHHDDDSSQPNRQHRHRGDLGEHDNVVDGEMPGRGRDSGDDEKQRGAEDDGSDSSASRRGERERNTEEVERLKRGAQDGEAGNRRRDRIQGEDGDSDIECRGNIRRDIDEEREQHHSDGGKYPR
ncbi:hypothetical protein LLEC1_00201 [Akanthomyces lecanii]|uniref:DUF8035 domain-containing protein n=1 Tax=Cordyceps confragosa TaxID=2714763 RepID=A0A179IKN5_CORDF|nr:hypothetical protein LLEC1_00201 [Akanthomyces lecanii]